MKIIFTNPLTSIFVVVLLTTSTCKERFVGHSDFQSSSSNAKPICYDLTGTVLTNPPSRDELAKAPITKYHIGSFSSAVAPAQSRLEDNTTLHQGMYVEEAAAIMLYTERTYTAINKSLYNRDCDKFKFFNEAIASGLNKAAALYGPIYRGGEIIESEMADFIAGNEFTASAFLSASTDQEIANRFKRNALFEIESEGLGFIGWISTNGGEATSSNEREVLIPPGSKFQITSVEDRQKYKYVKMKHLTKSKGSIRFPAQVPSSIQALSGWVTKSKIPSAMQSLQKIFKLGVYSGADCQFSIAQKTAGNLRFSVARQNQDEAAIDTSAIPDQGIETNSGLNAEWKYPTLKVSFQYLNYDRFETVTFDLDGDLKWVGASINDQHCSFKQPRSLSL